MNLYNFIAPLESVALLFLIGLLIKVIVTNLKKVDRHTQKMWDSAQAVQEFLQQIDQEFDLMNLYATSIKSVFLNFCNIHKDLSDGKKSMEEAIQEMNSYIPENFQTNFDNFVVARKTSNMPTDYSFSDLNEMKPVNVDKDNETELDVKSGDLQEETLIEL